MAAFSRRGRQPSSPVVEVMVDELMLTDGSLHSAAAPRSSSLQSMNTSFSTSRAHPLGGCGPKGGYLYIRVHQASNLNELARTSSCCGQGLLSASGKPGTAGACCDCNSSCWGCGWCCSPPHTDSVSISFSCIGLERTVRTKVASIDKEGQAMFREELLLRSLNFCSADSLKICMETKSGTTLAEASLPLRAALPTSLLSGNVKGCCEQWHEKGIGTGETWPPRQRILFRQPGPEIAGGVSKQPPFLELELLQLADGSSLLGATPLLLAIENRQETLVRGYLSFDCVERLSREEQAICLAAALHQQSLGLVLQLLEQIQPMHEHLLMVIRMGADELVEPLLQAGGPSLLQAGHAKATSSSGSSSQGRSAASRSGGAPAPQAQSRVTSGEVGGSVGAWTHWAWRTSDKSGGKNSSASSTWKRMHKGPVLTPLALACSLGDIKVVEALCQWARRSRVHLDPSAPLPVGSFSSRREGGVHTPGHGGAGSNTSLWNDLHDRTSDGDCTARFGDPPIVMAVRGKASLATKLRLCSILAQHGLSVDARSPADSWTALLAAVDMGSLELVSVLLKLGARLSTDRHLCFTPLHLACQMGHWQLVPCLVEAMQNQYNRVAAWGPSPQYVSLNLPDAYGRTALDILLLSYFSSPLSDSMGSSVESSKPGSKRQKAVDVLRQRVHDRLPDDPDIVCGWELLQVLNLLDAIPRKKEIGAHLMECEHAPEGASSRSSRDVPEQEQFGDLEKLLQAARLLVQAGARTRCLLQDLVQAPVCAANSECSVIDTIASSVRVPWPERSKCKFSPLDLDDLEPLSEGESYL